MSTVVASLLSSTSPTSSFDSKSPLAFTNFHHLDPPPTSSTLTRHLPFSAPSPASLSVSKKRKLAFLHFSADHWSNTSTLLSGRERAFRTISISEPSAPSLNDLSPSSASSSLTADQELAKSVAAALAPSSGRAGEPQSVGAVESKKQEEKQDKVKEEEGKENSRPPLVKNRSRSASSANTPLYRPNMSQLTDEGNVVVGRGKSGWNKLLTSSTSSSGRASPSLPLPTPTSIPLELAKEKGSLPPSIPSLPSPPPLPSSPDADGNPPERDVWAPPLSTVNVNATVNELKGKGLLVPKRIGEEDNDDHGFDDEDDEEDDAPTPHMFHGAGIFLLAGGIAGAVSRTATAPFDRLKVYLITSQDRSLPNPLDPPPLKGELKKKGPRRSAGRLPAAARALWKQGGGPLAFWTGNGLNVVKIFPESAIKFLSYESSKRVFAQYWDKVPDQTMISNSSRFISGGIGGVVSQFAIYPIETLKTRVMSSTGGRLSGNALIASTALDMWKAGGIRLFFKGLPAGLIGVFPYSAIDMSTYEGIKLAYAKWSGSPPEFPTTLIFGAISGGIGATSVYPLNLVRTRLQAQGTPAHPQVYTGIRDAALQCYVREGWRGFYKGLTPTLVKVIPAVAISYAVYEKSKQILFGFEGESGSHDHAEEN